MPPGSSHRNHKNLRPNKFQAQPTPALESQTLDKLNKRLKHLTDNVLPSTPYLISLPTDRPFNTSHYQNEDLLRHTPFKVGEEQLQYASFLASNWEDDDLIIRVGDLGDNRADDTNTSPQSQKMQSASATPKTVAKKISIGEYSKRASGKLGINGTSKQSGNPKRTEIVNNERGALSSGNELQPAQGAKELKRPAEGNGPEAEEPEKVRVTPPSKKPRTSLDSSGQQTKDGGSSTKLLLPDPISPTLPPLFEKRLAEIDGSGESDKLQKPLVVEKGSADESKPRKREGDKTLQASKHHAENRKSPSAKLSLVEGKKGSVEETTKLVPNGLGISTSKAEVKGQGASSITDLGLAIPNASSKSAARLQDDPRQKESKIVRLKIPRSIRKTVLRLLQLKPQSKPESLFNNKYAISAPRAGTLSEKESRLAQAKKHEQDVPGIKEERESQNERARSNTLESRSKPSEKRYRQEGEIDPLQSQSKRQKFNESRTSQAFKSPVVSSHGSSKKPRDSTPTAAIREEAVSTPSGSIRNGTPVAPSSVERPTTREARHTPSASGSSYTVTAETHDALKTEQQKYFDLGRSLKKDSDSIYKAGHSPMPSPSVMKKYLAIRVEVSLAFMLAYVVGDEICRMDRVPPRFEKTWQTLFPWLRQLQQQTADHRFLRGLSLQLEAVSHMIVWNLESEHTAATGFEKPESAKTIKRHYDEAQRMLIEGSALLSVDDLQQEFPKTWRSKARAPLAHSPPKLTASTLGGDFYLPITGITLPIEAVRAGRSLLSEWCKREGVEWTPKLNL